MTACGRQRPMWSVFYCASANAESELESALTRHPGRTPANAT
jgi:hypothetical protein